MSRTAHPNLSAADRAERRAGRRPRAQARRTATRSAIVTAEIREALR